jgi:hypothetical protein
MRIASSLRTIPKLNNGTIRGVDQNGLLLFYFSLRYLKKGDLYMSEENKIVVSVYMFVYCTAYKASKELFNAILDGRDLKLVTRIGLSFIEMYVASEAAVKIAGSLYRHNLRQKYRRFI